MARELSASDRYAKMIDEMAVKAFAEHEIEVKLEQGLYRHYRCAKPGTGIYHFHVVTFPGRILVCGDIGDMCWERVPDMFTWAPGALDSISYLEEKVWRTIKTEEFNKEVAEEHVLWDFQSHTEDLDLEDPKDAEEYQKHVEIRDELLNKADDNGPDFYTAYYESDWYGGDMISGDGYTANFLWARSALKWFFANYDYTKVIVPGAGG